MNQKTKTSAIDAFKTDPIPKIVIKNSIPALIAMMMVMVYNLADTFFLGLTRNDLYVTAVSFATPLFMIFMSLGTLFGVGGTSVISRALGEGNAEYARKASSLISNCFSSVVRTEGEAMKAMTGTLVGNLLNMILDPIFIFGFRWGVAGAAAATVIGNAVAAGYYILYFLRGRSALSIHPKYFSMKEKILTGVLSVGISASLANLLVSVSSIVVNAQLSQYVGGDMLVAGYGVTAKVIMIVTLIGIGIGSGVQPFLGYCYGAKEKERLTGGIRFSAMFGLVFCLAVSALCYIFAEPIVKVFLTDLTALDSGVHFTRILMSTAWLIGAFAICQNTLQAIGAATPALLASIFRQGVIFIPAMFIMKAVIGVDGLIWAQPIADVLSLVIVVCMLRRRIKKTDFTGETGNV